MIIAALLTLTLAAAPPPRPAGEVSPPATDGATPPTPPAERAPPPADDSAPPPPPTATSPASPAPPPVPFEPVSDDDGLLRLQIPWTEPSGQGLALGYDNGAWGGEWSQGVRVLVPLGAHFGVDVRGLMVLASAGAQDAQVHLGGRLELIGRSPVLLNVLRLYGGGGVQLFAPVGEAPSHAATMGGGGHFGFEFFMMPSMSWILEVGGQSGVADGVGGGASIVAGLQLYPF